MNRRRGKGGSGGGGGGGGGGGQRPQVKAVPGARVAIERAWLTAVLADADPHRIAQLERMLTPAANDAFEAIVVSGEGPLPPADLVDHEAPPKKS